MKTQKTNSISLKKLTIARINPEKLNNIKGGSSVPPTGSVRVLGGPCLHDPR